MSETKISQPVLDAHAQFGGDLESMQKLYDYASLVEENRRLREENERLRDELASTIEELIDHNGDDMIGSRAGRVTELRGDAK